MLLQLLERSRQKFRAPRRRGPAFSQWARRHRKAYYTTAEWARRLEVWASNLRYAVEWNQANKHRGFWLGPSPFADLSLDEWRGRFFGLDTSLASRKRLRGDLTSSDDDDEGHKHRFKPARVRPNDPGTDWRGNATSGVKNQQMRVPFQGF